MGPQYPELNQDSDRIKKVAEAEEDTFLSTLKSGTLIFDQARASLISTGGKIISGEDAFKLHDTYGFPFDLTLEMANESGLSIDCDGFKRLMREQKERAKADAKSKKTGHTDLSEYRKIAESAKTLSFVGYEHSSAEASIVGVLVDGKPSKSVSVGSEVEIVLDRTPFYAEGGGQLADGGVIRTAEGSLIEIDDVQAPLPGVFVHRGRVSDGEVRHGVKVFAEIDRERRAGISRAHTATHMVHKAFREILGETATQAGSENAPGRFRFDFPAAGAVPKSSLEEVELRVNTLLLEDLEVTAEEMSINEAKSIGAMALFGEKYGERVRVVSVGDWAKELCGGTHVHRSGQLGLIKLLSESSIGSGVRRIEALVGVDAYSFLAREHVILNSLTELIKGTRPEELPERISKLLLKIKEMEKEFKSIKLTQAKQKIPSLISQAEAVAPGISLILHNFDGELTGEELRTLAIEIRERVKGSVVVLSSLVDDRVVLVSATDEVSRSAGIKAGDLAKKASAILGGGGGGKDDFAQGGGTDISKLDSAFLAIRTDLKSTQ
jgi:alanyl-tRNA synthetase